MLDYLRPNYRLHLITNGFNDVQGIKLRSSNLGHYFEQVTNQILDDLVKAVRPRRMTVVGRFNVRGGISSQVVAGYPHVTSRRSRG